MSVYFGAPTAGSEHFWFNERSHRRIDAVAADRDVRRIERAIGFLRGGGDEDVLAGFEIGRRRRDKCHDRDVRRYYDCLLSVLVL
jgi:hypothetical protein